MSNDEHKSGDDAADKAADLLDFVLAGRPERVADAVLAGQPPEVRGAITAVTESLAALALAEPAAAPSPGLRARVLAGFAAKQRTAKKAVLVIDMINDHLTPGKVLEVPRARGIVPALQRRLDEARAAGLPVVYVLDRHQPDDPDLDQWGAHAVEGTEGADVWPALAPKAGDRIVTHPSYSGFFGSELDRVLREELKVDTLVVTGCLTELQMMTTAADAMQRGYAVEVPEDSQAGTSESAEQGALGVLRVMRPYAPSRIALIEAISI